MSKALLLQDTAVMRHDVAFRDMQLSTDFNLRLSFGVKSRIVYCW